jgi:PPOX class probable F420-dependent enzyme
MTKSEGNLRHDFRIARVARLATVRPDGRPHVVPVTFAAEADAVWSAIDHKPKRTTRLQRLANIAANPAVSVIVDHYDEDWQTLWWVRADGTARIVEAGPERAEAVAHLQAKYAQYRQHPPTGPVIAIAVDRWATWSAGSARS